MSSSNLGTLTVRMAPVAAAQLKEIKQRADANPNGFEGCIWKVLKGYVNTALRRTDVALSTATELGSRKHDFTGIRRGKINLYDPGVRIIFIASAAKQAVTILLLAERKQGQPDDAYEVLAAHLAAGDFDVALAEFSIPKPVIPLNRHGGAAPPIAAPWLRSPSSVPPPPAGG